MAGKCLKAEPHAINKQPGRSSFPSQSLLKGAWASPSPATASHSPPSSVGTHIQADLVEKL